MACFITPMVVAIITTIIQKIARKLSEKLKLSILTTLLWGGSIILMLEHVWHGEVVPWPPFLTAMSNPSEIPVMINEILTTGSLMTLAISATWASTLAIIQVMNREKTYRLEPKTYHTLR